MKIIGISGKKGSGKDTVADILISLHREIKIGKVGFASALKAEVSRAIGLPNFFIDNHKDNFRLILQGWGTDFRRKMYGEDYWLKKMDQALAMFESVKYDVVIIPDVRFLNEAKYIKDQGGLLIRVIRPMSGPIDIHPSEIELDDSQFDTTIYNNKDLNSLAQEVKQIIV
jgi:hypothetical protein